MHLKPGDAKHDNAYKTVKSLYEGCKLGAHPTPETATLFSVLRPRLDVSSDAAVPLPPCCPKLAICNACFASGVVKITMSGQPGGGTCSTNRQHYAKHHPDVPLPAPRFKSAKKRSATADGVVDGTAGLPTNAGAGAPTSPRGGSKKPRQRRAAAPSNVDDPTVPDTRRYQRGSDQFRVINEAICLFLCCMGLSAQHTLTVRPWLML